MRALWHVGDKIAATSDCVNHMQQDVAVVVATAAAVHVRAASTLECAARAQKFFDSQRTVEQAKIRNY